MVRTIFRDLVPEGSNAVYESALLDHQGAAIPAASILSLTLTLRDQATDGIVNSRDDVNVLNANGGTVDLSGVFVMVFDPLDTVAIGTAQRQVRLATFKLTFVGGVVNHEVQFTVFNMADVP